MAANYLNITTNATTPVANGAGVLNKIVVNLKSTGASTLKIFDNTVGSGTLIGTIDQTAQAGTYLYDCTFKTGLTIVTAAATTAADITVCWQ